MMLRKIESSTPRSKGSRKREILGLAWVLETSKTTSSDILLLTRPQLPTRTHLLIMPLLDE